jgi:transposase
MNLDLSKLPTEIGVLHGIIATLQTEQELLKKQAEILEHRTKFLEEKDRAQVEEILRLNEKLSLLRSKLYGKSSEKLDKKTQKTIQEKIEDLELRLKAIKSEENDGGEANKEVDKARRKKFPEHLPREEVVLSPDAECPSCGGEEFEKIGEDTSETLEYVPAKFKVVKHKRPICKCKKCHKIVQAYPASKAIEKGNAGPGLLAHVIIQKYCDHLPLYRQSQIFARENVEISSSTLTDWVSACGKLLEPLAQKIKDYVFASEQLHGDDTIVKVMDPGRGKTKTGRIWTYVRDGRPHGNKDPVAACYFYSPDRKAVHPEGHLKNYKGVMHADAYAGYNKLYIGSENEEASIKEAGCWAHTRRKFYEVTVVSDNAIIANETIDQIRKMYEIEERIRGSSPEIRHKVRQEETKELLNELFEFWKKAYSKLPKKSRTSKAIQYAFNNKDALMSFLDNGKIEIDNNAAERALRSAAVGRKNWLFAGSDQGGEAAAVLYTILETTKLNGINPWQYLSRVLDIIQDHPFNKMEDLLPWNLDLGNTN